MVSANCNDPDDTVDGLVAATIDLDDYLGEGSSTRLEWGETDFTADCTSVDVGMGASGAAYRVYGSCGGEWREESLSSRIYRDTDGSLDYSDTDLAW